MPKINPFTEFKLLGRVPKIGHKWLNLSARRSVVPNLVQVLPRDLLLQGSALTDASSEYDTHYKKRDKSELFAKD